MVNQDWKKVNSQITENFRLLGKRIWTRDAITKEDYPVETADWEEMGQKSESWWQSKAFRRASNAELVENGVFAGER